MKHLINLNLGFKEPILKEPFFFKLTREIHKLQRQAHGKKR